MRGLMCALVMAIATAASAPAWAQSESLEQRVERLEAGAARIAQLEQQLQAQRRLTRAMAADIEKYKREVEGLEAYLIALDRLEAYEKWKVEWPEKRDAERAEALRKIREQRLAEKKAERERRLAEMAAARQAKREAVANSPRYSVQATLGLIEAEGGTVTYIELDRLGRDFILEEHPRIDRQNVMVRGTFKNESAQAYQYEFEIGVAGVRSGRFGLARQGVLGRWRYQTPVLKPGELHQFEVKVPVTDAYDASGYDVGNVRAMVPVETEPVRDEGEAGDGGGEAGDEAPGP